MCLEQHIPVLLYMDYLLGMGFDNARLYKHVVRDSFHRLGIQVQWVLGLYKKIIHYNHIPNFLTSLI